MFSKTLVRTVRTAYKVGPARFSVRAQSSNALSKTALPFTYSSSGPTCVKYTTQHEWLAAHSDGTAFLGITKYAADALGDATYVELPEKETQLEAGEPYGSVESVKSASEVYQPVAGEIIEANTKLESQPQLINQDPLGEGWIARIKIADPQALESQDDLMSLEQYERSLKEDEH